MHRDPNEEYAHLFKATTERMADLQRRLRELMAEVQEALRILREHGLLTGELIDAAYEAETFAAEWLGEVPPSYEVFLYERENA